MKKSLCYVVAFYVYIRGDYFEKTECYKILERERRLSFIHAPKRFAAAEGIYKSRNLQQENIHTQYFEMKRFSWYFFTYTNFFLFLSFLYIIWYILFRRVGNYHVCGWRGAKATGVTLNSGKRFLCAGRRLQRVFLASHDLHRLVTLVLWLSLSLSLK